MEMPRGKQSSNRLIFSYIFQWKLGDDLAKCHRQQRSSYQFLHCKEVTNLPVVTTFTEVVLNNRFRERNSVNSFYLVSQLLAFFILKYFLSKVTNWEQLKPEKKNVLREMKSSACHECACNNNKNVCILNGNRSHDWLLYTLGRPFQPQPEMTCAPAEKQRKWISVCN